MSAELNEASTTHSNQLGDDTYQPELTWEPSSCSVCGLPCYVEEGTMLFDRFVCPDCTADAQNLYDQLYLDQPDPELTECLQHIADLDADIDRKLAERSVVMANFEADHVAEVLAIGPRVDMRTDAEWWAAEHAGDGLTTVRGGPFATCVGSALDIERIEQQQDQWDQWDAEPDAKVAAVPRGGVMSADDG